MRLRQILAVLFVVISVALDHRRRAPTNAGRPSGVGGDGRADAHPADP